jgi:hypothetical protein
LLVLFCSRVAAEIARLEKLFDETCERAGYWGMDDGQRL